MGDVKRVEVKYPVLLDVLKEMPVVVDQNVDKTAEVLHKASKGTVLGKMSTYVTFDRGNAKGDGEIYAIQKMRDDSGKVVDTKLYINDYGKVWNPDTNFEGTIPPALARYFIATIFGADELRGTDTFFIDAASASCQAVGFGQADQKQFNPYLDNSCTGFFDYQVNGVMQPYMSALLNGAGLLYEAAESKGGVNKAYASQGAKMVQGVKDRTALKLSLMAQSAWDDAGDILKASKNKEGVRSAMEKYEEHKPEKQPLTFKGALNGYVKSVMMIREVAAADEAGFKDECCELELGAYKCGYGVFGGTKKSIPFLKAPVAGSKS